MRRSFVPIALAAAAAITSPAAAQTKDQPAQTGDEIVVEGTRQEVRNQLKAILEPSGGMLSRFDRGFCPIVIGFDAEWTVMLDDLIRANARDLGIEPQEKGCTPTAVVIFSDQPQELVQGLRKKMPLLFETLYVREIERIIDKKRTSYSWRATSEVARDGSVTTSLGALNDQLSNAPVIRSFSASRLYSPTEYKIFNSYLILDITKTPGMTLQQIADFASMNLLLDLDEEAVSNAPAGSILALFDAQDPAAITPGFSAFDRGLLKSLYSAEDLARNVSRQTGRLAAEMAKDPEIEGN